LLAAVDGENAVRRNLTGGLLELEVALVFQALRFAELLVLRGLDLAELPENVAHRGTNLRRLRDHLRQDVLDAKAGGVRRGDAALWIDEAGQDFVEAAGGRGIAVPNGPGERLEALLAGSAGEALLLGLVGKIKVFEPARRVGAEDRLAQLVGEAALVLDAAQD